MLGECLPTGLLMFLEDLLCPEKHLVQFHGLAAHHRFDLAIRGLGQETEEVFCEVRGLSALRAVL